MGAYKASVDKLFQKNFNIVFMKNVKIGIKKKFLYAENYFMQKIIPCKKFFYAENFIYAEKFLLCRKSFQAENSSMQKISFMQKNFFYAKKFLLGINPFTRQCPKLTSPSFTCKVGAHN